MKALALTAGLGTRLRPYTDQCAKPAIPFLGIPLLHHVWTALAPLGINDLVVNFHHRPQDVRRVSELLQKDHSQLRLSFSDETEQILDSGGGVNQLRSFFKDERTFLVANGDEIFFPHNPPILQDFLSRHQAMDNLATLLVTEHPEVGKKFGGAFADSSHQVNCFSKKPVDGMIGWHYVGVILLSNRFFHYAAPQVMPENLLYDVITRGMNAGERVEVFPADMNWYEVGNPQDFLAATTAVLDAIHESTDVPWVSQLIQTIRWSHLLEPLVEKENPEILRRVQKTLDAIKCT